MTSSLVGSEMCIRDRGCPARPRILGPAGHHHRSQHASWSQSQLVEVGTCLLYTSDAADDM
eukprot:9120376-Prorocentrum_lima.AAC.1